MSKVPEQEAERVQKVLARAGVGSRRGVEAMIREGRITVNGKLAVLGQKINLSVDAVKADGHRVIAPPSQRRYLLLNKPAGCVSTNSDPEGRPTVLELLPQRLRRGLFPVGRLDFESEGLLILTDDGEFAERVAHPRYGCHKTYEVKVKGRPSREELARLIEGIPIDGRRAAALSVTPRSAPSGPRASVSNSWWTVTLGEGRNRLIRELFFRIGHPVSRLRRVAIGALIDPRLPRGAWRELTVDEVDRLRGRAKAAKSKRPGGRGRPSGKGKGPKGAPSRGRKGPAGRKTAGKPGRGRRRG